jgi:hypothetical protein
MGLWVGSVDFVRSVARIVGAWFDEQESQKTSLLSIRRGLRRMEMQS